jgi:hypothetical protein
VQSPLPRFPGSFDPICVYPLQRFQPGAEQRCAAPTERNRNEELERIRPLLAQLESLRTADHLEVWDAFTVLCPVDQIRCSTHQGHVRLFRDEAHLSARGAELLLPSLRTVVLSGRSGGIITSPHPKRRGV